jgi:plastocyanin
MKSGIVSFAALAAASALLIGCPSKKEGGKTGGATSAPTTKAPAGGKAAATPKPAAATAKMGKGVIVATVKFSGKAPEMKVPKKRKEAELCKDKAIVYNAVLVKDGKLKDVFVGIAPEQVQGEYEASTTASLDQKDCMYEPRIQGVLAGQAINIKNSDGTLHNVNAGFGTKTLFNTAQPKGAPDLKKEDFDDLGVYKFKCDVHPWMRSFVVVSDNPFYGITAADGTVKIEKVPAGKWKLMAWHSQYGKKEASIEVKDGEVKVEFEFKDSDAEPAENKGELTDLF